MAGNLVAIYFKMKPAIILIIVGLLLIFGFVRYVQSLNPFEAYCSHPIPHYKGETGHGQTLPK